MGTGKIARKLGAALLDDAAKGFKGPIFLDAGGHIEGESPQEAGRDFAVNALVRQDPDLSLEEGNEYENARLLVGLVDPLLKKGVDGPFPHSLLDPPAVEEGELHVREYPEKTHKGKKEHGREGNVEPDGEVMQGHGEDE